MKTPEWIKAGQTVTDERIEEAVKAGLPMDEIWKGRTLNRKTAEAIKKAFEAIEPKKEKKEKKEGEK